jgi:hypothetical protein
MRRPFGSLKLVIKQRYTFPCVKHSQHIMVWGAMSAAGPIELWIQPRNTTINFQGYLQILEANLTGRRLPILHAHHSARLVSQLQCADDFSVVWFITRPKPNREMLVSLEGSCLQTEANLDGRFGGKDQTGVADTNFLCLLPPSD